MTKIVAVEVGVHKVREKDIVVPGQKNVTIRLPDLHLGSLLVGLHVGHLHLPIIALQNHTDLRKEVRKNLNGNLQKNPKREGSLAKYAK